MEDGALGNRKARSAALELLAARPAGATICPSEVARLLAARSGRAEWRDEMTAVHSEIDLMVADGLVRLSWKGEPMAERSGPYRIGRPGAEAADGDGVGEGRR
ncbi:MAG TPA: DUF3253 domain-containing protein [Allosphingosinicella sp.]|nr:DUF3253 domain-containing protein [Allosphingosinicella sp.]